VNVTYNGTTGRVEWAPYRGDYGAHYGTELIPVIEAGNCVKGCTHAGKQKAIDEFGPGGICSVLARVGFIAYGEIIPELDPRPTGPHCYAREDPATAGMDPLFPEVTP
jgi:hypothetical protein